MKNKAVKYIRIGISFFLSACILLFIFVWNGVILLNSHHAKKYDIRGIDVSSYQGDVDWNVLSAQNISFAFIKATEGSSFVDEKFDYNFLAAQKTPLAIGAYHFFSFDSDGKTQAENFIKHVVPFDGMLPPVIDLEFYGDNEKNPPDRKTVGKQLKTMLSLLEDHYGQKPIIYATEKSYQLYLSGDYEEYDIWIRNVISKPALSDDRTWTFWQYTNRAQLDGYVGQEKYIDVNVFHGDFEEYHAYVERRGYTSSAHTDSDPE